MFQFKVVGRDVDYRGELKLSILCGHILSSAQDAASSLGFGLEDVRERGYSWVISSLGVEIYTKIAVGETLSIKTWIEKMNRLYSYRHYEVFNSQNELVAAATSTWSLINFKERTLANIVQVLGKGAATGVPSTIAPSPRITTIESDSSRTFTALYSDLDTNRHVNSINYIDWIVDSLPIETLGLIKRFDIGYLREVFYGESVEVVVSKQIDNCLQFVVNHCSDSKISCSGVITYLDAQ